jgi:hypothetical protein
LLQFSMNLPRAKSHIHFRCLSRARESVHFRGGCKYLATYIFLRWVLLAPLPTLKLEGHPMSAVRDCLFNISAAALHVWRPAAVSATWGRAMPWWQDTRLSWGNITAISSKHIYLFIPLWM